MCLSVFLGNFGIKAAQSLKPLVQLNKIIPTYAFSACDVHAYDHPPINIL